MTALERFFRNPESARALAWWAVLEVGWGDSPFRRVLGAAVLLAILAAVAIRLIPT